MEHKHSSEVKYALNKTGLLEKVTYQSKLSNWPKIAATFTKSGYRYPLWDNLGRWLGITYPFAWEWFDVILSEKEVILFFELDENDGIFLFKDGKDLVSVLEECYRFTFYVTDSNASFLLAYNDHQNLIATGSAEKWLLDTINKRGLELKIYKSVN